MPRMIMFRLNRECRDVAVNAASVLYVSHYEAGASSLHFGKDCFIRVQGALPDVVNRLEEIDSGASAKPQSGAERHAN